MEDNETLMATFCEAIATLTPKPDKSLYEKKIQNNIFHELSCMQNS